MTGPASVLGQGDVQHDVHLYSEDNVSGLVGTGLGGTGVNLSESQQIRENKKDLQWDNGIKNFEYLVVCYHPSRTDILRWDQGVTKKHRNIVSQFFN